MKKFAAFLLAIAMLTGMSVDTADAGPKNKSKPNTECLRAGQAVLRDLGVFSAAARGEVDYSAFADAEAGPIFLDLEEGSFLPINTVFKLHKSNPELFAWCN